MLGAGSAKESGMGSDTQAWYGGPSAQPGAPTDVTGGGPVARTGGAGIGGPSRRAVALALLGSTAAACITGAMIGLLRPAPDAVVPLLPPVSAAPPDSATAVASTPASDAASPAASASPSPSASASPSAKPTPSPDQAGFVQEPWKDPGLDFAVITGIRSEGVRVVLKVDRLQFLTGDAAKKYYSEHPDQPVQDYAIVNANPKIYTYTLVPGAPLFGAQVLAGSPQAQQLDAATLVDRVGKALAGQQRVYVWLHHQEGGRGWTTYLAEQYLP